MRVDESSRNSAPGSKGTQSAIAPQDPPLSQSEYRDLRNGALFDLIAYGILLFLASIFPILGICVSYTVLEGENPLAEILAVAIWLYVCMKLLRLAFRKFGSLVRESYAALEAVRSRRPERERKQRGPRTRKNRRAWIIAAVLVVAVGILISIFVKADRAKTDEIYRTAESYIEDEEYEAARILLEGIRGKSYKDTTALIALCKAHQAYEAGNVPDAYHALEGVRFRYQTVEQTGKNYEFLQLLRNEYETKYDEAAIARRARQEEINKKPFPSEGQHVGVLQYRWMVRQYRDNSTCWCPTTLYRCTIGDYTYKLWISDTDTIIKVELYSVTPQPGKTTSGSSGKKPTAPEFDVDAFSNPEDFYDWYVDDFIDFEEAEEYYYDHGGA